MLVLRGVLLVVGCSSFVVCCQVFDVVVSVLSSFCVCLLVFVVHWCLLFVGGCLSGLVC